VRQGVAGYVTPKVAIGAIVGNDQGQILLVQRADSGAWLYPTGWADVGYSAAEVAVKEVLEETGIDVEPCAWSWSSTVFGSVFTQVPLYSLVFHLRPVGGRAEGTPARVRRCRMVRRGLPSFPAGQCRRVDRARVRRHTGRLDRGSLRLATWADLATRRPVGRRG